MIGPEHVLRGLARPARVPLALAVLVACLVCAAPALARPGTHPLELIPGSFHVSTSSAQAGAHADLTVSFDFAHEAGGGATYDDARTTVVELPAGFIGNKEAVPACTFAQLVGNAAGGEAGSPECPVASQVGTISFDIFIAGSGFEHVTIPLYNMEVTSFGVAAQLGFNVAGVVVQVLNASLRPGDSGITITSPNIERLGEVRNVSVTTWGLPASRVHDAQRGEECYSHFSPECKNGGQAANFPVRPFLANPTSCEPHLARMRADSWEEPDNWTSAETEATPPTGECERVPFGPSIEVAPTTRAVESSSGLEVSLLVPQAQAWESPSGVATAHLKDSVVTLPVGYTANPSLASGLGVCTMAQFEAESSSSAFGADCPPESKIGEVDVQTPVLSEHLTGNIYIAKPFENQFGSLLGLYIVVKDPARGILVKLAGKIEPNETTGQLVTTFDNNPQVPFSRFTLKLRQGANSPLVSPPACGSYAALADLTPWSDPLAPQRVFSPAFNIETGIGGGPCPAGGVPPFHPGIVAGTVSNSAGAYSPLEIEITRHDGEQEITRFSSQFPPGLSAKLAGVPFCPDADIEAAKSPTRKGTQEEAEPSCPASSEIGHSLVGAGVGGVLAWTPGKVYMAGPYNGAPFSIVAITSAKVGPFDLGTVVVREALEINPLTAAVTVDAKASDPIPHIIKGIVVHVREIRVYVDRPQFMINPTSCEPMSIAATVNGAGAAPSHPSETPATVASRFQLANCQNLKFQPKFSVSTSAKTSRADGASLTAKLAVPGALGTQANISRVKVELPKQLPSRLPTLQKACIAAQFETNPAGCPAASIIGHAKAITPILPVPLEGPAYFVSHGGEGWPSLIVVLQGYGVTIDLVGTTFISKAGVTSSTFKTVPDQPVTSFELTLPEGPYSALTALGNLCTAKELTMPTELFAQNGAEITQSTKIAVTGCPKHKQAAKKKARHRRKKTSHHKAKP